MLKITPQMSIRNIEHTQCLQHTHICCGMKSMQNYLSRGPRDIYSQSLLLGHSVVQWSPDLLFYICKINHVVNK